jgi:hypothetical protein
VPLRWWQSRYDPIKDSYPTQPIWPCLPSRLIFPYNTRIKPCLHLKKGANMLFCELSFYQHYQTQWARPTYLQEFPALRACINFPLE